MIARIIKSKVVIVMVKSNVIGSLHNQTLAYSIFDCAIIIVPGKTLCKTYSINLKYRQLLALF